MRIVSYAAGPDDEWRAGVVSDGEVIDVGPSVRGLLNEIAGPEALQQRVAG